MFGPILRAPWGSRNPLPGCVRVVTVVSDTARHIAVALGEAAWAFRDNGLRFLPDRARRIQLGDLGVFYVARGGGSPGYLCNPFMFLSTPSDEQARRMDERQLWRGGPHRLGFSFEQLTKGVGHIGERLIRVLRTVQESPPPANYSHVLHLTGRCALKPIDIFIEDWEFILRKCGGDMGGAA